MWKSYQREQSERDPLTKTFPQKSMKSSYLWMSLILMFLMCWPRVNQMNVSQTLFTPPLSREGCTLHGNFIISHHQRSVLFFNRHNKHKSLNTTRNTDDSRIHVTFRILLKKNISYYHRPNNSVCADCHWIHYRQGVRSEEHLADTNMKICSFSWVPKTSINTLFITLYALRSI